MSSATASAKNPRVRRWVVRTTLIILTIVLLPYLAFRNANRPVSILLPVPGQPSPNGFNLAQKAITSLGTLREPPPSAAEWKSASNDQPRLSRWRAEALVPADQLRAALRTSTRMPLQRTWKTPSAFPSSLKQFVATLNALGYLEWKRGQKLEAIGRWLDGLETCAALPVGGSLEAHQEAQDLEIIWIDALDRAIPQLAPAELDHLATRLNTIRRLRADYSEIALEEGYLQTARTLTLPFRGERSADPECPVKDYSEFLRLVAGVPNGKSPSWPQIKEMISFAYADKEKMIRTNLAFFEYSARNARGGYSGFSMMPTPQNPMMFARGNAINEYRAKHLSHILYLDILRTETALHRYRAKHNVWPESLEKLMPDYWSGPAVDPFGTPLKYVHSQSADPLLYSFGADRHDDNGKPEKGVGGSPGDVVAGQLRIR